MIGWLLGRSKERRLPWRLILVLCAIAFVVLLLFNLDKFRSDGFTFGQSTPDTTGTTRSRVSMLDKNEVLIRNEVYVINGEEVAFAKLRDVLTELKREKPKAVLELKLAGDEKQGMVHEVERAAEQLGLTLQK